MTVSIRSVLHNTQFKRADPVVEVEGKDLDTPVRWVFTNEREDVSSFLSGGEMLIIASNSYLLQGGDSYPAFRAGTNYGELDMPYSQPLHEYLAAHQGLTAVVAVPVGTQA